MTRSQHTCNAGKACRGMMEYRRMEQWVDKDEILFCKLRQLEIKIKMVSDL
jgi:hypothetical protein